MVEKVTAEDLQAKHHCVLLTMRCQDRIIESDNFAAAWTCANDEQREECLKFLSRMETDKLKTWINTILFSDLTATTVVLLRRLASNNRIKGYCNMSKDELLEALKSRGIKTWRNQES